MGPFVPTQLPSKSCRQASCCSAAPAIFLVIGASPLPIFRLGSSSVTHMTLKTPHLPSCVQVWLVAAEQAAAVAAGDSVVAGSGQVGSQQLVASLAMGSGAPADATDPSGGDGGLDLAALLLDGRNAPLRRIAMDANPAKTIASMPREMKAQLKDVSVNLGMVVAEVWGWLLLSCRIP